MLEKKQIVDTLTLLDQRYNDALLASSQQDSIFYSKLAILEYCGWIEDIFDKIVRRSVKGKLRTQDYQKILEKSVVGRNYGFQYEEHFRQMLIKAIGLKQTENIEIHLKRNGYLPILISELAAVKQDRDSAAHTWVKNTTRTYPAPSVTKSRVNKVYPIAKEIYSLVVSLR